MKLPGSTKSKINKDKNGENVTHLVLVHCNIVNNDYQEPCIHLFLKKSFGQLLDISPKNFISLKTFDSEYQYI